MDVRFLLRLLLLYSEKTEILYTAQRYHIHISEKIRWKWQLWNKFRGSPDLQQSEQSEELYEHMISKNLHVSSFDLFGLKVLLEEKQFYIEEIGLESSLSSSIL